MTKEQTPNTRGTSRRGGEVVKMADALASSFKTEDFRPGDILLSPDAAPIITDDNGVPLNGKPIETIDDLSNASDVDVIAAAIRSGDEVEVVEFEPGDVSDTRRKQYLQLQQLKEAEVAHAANHPTSTQAAVPTVASAKPSHLQFVGKPYNNTYRVGILITEEVNNYIRSNCGDLSLSAYAIQLIAESLPAVSKHFRRTDTGQGGLFGSRIVMHKAPPRKRLYGISIFLSPDESLQLAQLANNITISTALFLSECLVATVAKHTKR